MSGRARLVSSVYLWLTLATASIAECDMMLEIRRLQERVLALEEEVFRLREERHTSRTPSPQEGSDNGWRLVSRRRRFKPDSKISASPPLTTTNVFSSLEEVDLSKAEEGTLPASKTLIVGDSQVRYLDRAFCDRDRRNRTRVCFPGAGVREVGDRVARVMAGEGSKPIVCFSAGGNDIGRTTSEELRRRFREALGRVRDLGGRLVVCGVLPRKNVSCDWLSRAIAVNSWLADHCKSNGWAFVDNWDSFFRQKHHASQRRCSPLSQRGGGVCCQPRARD